MHLQRFHTASARSCRRRGAEIGRSGALLPLKDGQLKGHMPSAVKLLIMSMSEAPSKHVRFPVGSRHCDGASSAGSRDQSEHRALLP
jgi:hypothetical protein